MLKGEKMPSERRPDQTVTMKMKQLTQHDGIRSSPGTEFYHDLQRTKQKSIRTIKKSRNSPPIHIPPWGAIRPERRHNSKHRRIGCSLLSCCLLKRITLLKFIPIYLHCRPCYFYSLVFLLPAVGLLRAPNEWLMSRTRCLCTDFAVLFPPR